MIQLLALILFIFAIILGDVCSNIFDVHPSPLATTLGNMTSSINKVFIIQENCVAGKSIMKSLFELDILDQNSANLTILASNQINTLDFNSVTGFNISNVLDLSASPSTMLAPLIGLNLAGLSTTSLTTATSKLDSIRAGLVSLKTTVDSTLAVGGLTFSPNPAASGDDTKALNDMQDRLNTDAIAITNGISLIDAMKTKITTLSTLISTTQNRANLAIVYDFNLDLCKYPSTFVHDRPKWFESILSPGQHQCVLDCTKHQNIHQAGHS